MAFNFKNLRNINFNFFTSDLGVDLGTANVLIYVEGQGVVIREPSVVAVDKNTGKILQVGADARNMMGRPPGNVVAMRPLKDGVIAEFDATAAMLRHFFKKVSGYTIMSRPKVIMMDEPSLGLAPLVVKDIFKIIETINKEGITVLLIEQNANMALKVAHKAYVIETGTITMEGTGAELLANEEIKNAQ